MLEFSDELASEGVMLVDKVIVSTLSNVVHQFSGTVHCSGTSAKWNDSSGVQ